MQDNTMQGNADGFETVQKMGYDLEKSGQLGNDLKKIRTVLKLSEKWEMIRKNLDGFETVRKMGYDLEKSGQLGNDLKKSG